MADDDQSTINNNLTNNKIYSTSSLTAKEIYEHLLNFKVSNNTHTDIIRNLKGTQSNCFIYYVTDKKKHEDWKVDGYKWWNNGSKKPLPSKQDPKLMCSYYCATLNQKQEVPKGQWFKKRVMTLNVNKPENYPDAEPIFIQYAGDESYFQPGPHGNAKSNEAKSTTYVRTLPSLLNQMKEDLQNKNPSEFYMSQSIRNKPRDKKQCRNIKQAINKNKRISYDEFANLHALHIAFKFPSSFTSAPDLESIAIDIVLLDEVKQVIKSYSKYGKSCLQYDTTFNLSGYYVSSVTFIAIRIFS
jgi:hypothetical protein